MTSNSSENLHPAARAAASAPLEADIPEPEQVNGLEDVRQAIDTIDAQIIGLLSKRLDYVKAAADFKPDLQAVPAPERVREMLNDRSDWASALGLNPDFIAPWFAQISEWFIRQQIAHWPNRNHRPR
ncbi:isochorismate lyase [Ruegeria sp. Ofav3-42]|uniref:isochorismate lyase n=1 Tax=Ruegeria sp. Ofav3-42 TaxID=2917759 RepID=UPI001EF6F151|nr:isochorismate lyase [Ruegeria sp. Ofav3-42]MCG7521796.1 isochorismate lyase [Ruegeria sp. Ofav3-42]